MPTARYRVRVQKIEELIVEVEARSIEDARFFVEHQTGHLALAPEGGHGVKSVIDLKTFGDKPAKFRVIGKHEYVKNR